MSLCIILINGLENAAHERTNLLFDGGPRRGPSAAIGC